MNNESDTLQLFEKFYFVKVAKDEDFKVNLTKGLYVLILDHRVDIDKVDLSINRKFDSPTLFQRHGGYYSFEISKAGINYINFEYQGDKSLNGLFGMLFRVAPRIIGTPYGDFSVKDIDGNVHKSEDLKGTPALFLHSFGLSSTRHQVFLHEIKKVLTEFPEVPFFIISRGYPSQLRAVKDSVSSDQFVFVSGKGNLLGDWIEISSGFDLLLADGNGDLRLKNRITDFSKESAPRTISVLRNSLLQTK